MVGLPSSRWRVWTVFLLVSVGALQRGQLLLFAYSKEIRKIIYTTNAIESLHMELRKALKNRGHFPSDEAATKLIYLALRNITKKWNPPDHLEAGGNPVCHPIR